MRTGCSLTVCWSQLPGGVCSRGGCLLRGVCSGGGSVCSGGGVYPSMHWGRHPSCPLWTDRCLWKYYLGPTSLRPVTRMHSSKIRTICSSSHLSRGGGVQSRHPPAPPDQAPPCGQTDTCKNITFATSLQTVKRPLRVTSISNMLSEVSTV